jgi:hypothetical protein
MTESERGLIQKARTLAITLEQVIGERDEQKRIADEQMLGANAVANALARRLTKTEAERDANERRIVALRSALIYYAEGDFESLSRSNSQIQYRADEALLADDAAARESEPDEG